jgi:BirA family biotin operon repressor/biotin-[acetyl-CoA-carboxylase] ligase
MQLSILASLCVAENVEDVLPEYSVVNCKWPNDVLVQERKISGILLETQTKPQGDIDWLIIGIGLNVKSFPKDVELPATSLIHEGAKQDICAEIMLELIIRRFLSNYKIWKKIGFKPIREAWLCRLAWLGKKITVRLEHETLTGEFKALDKDGALILSYNGDERRITAGDVFV